MTNEQADRTIPSPTFQLTINPYNPAQVCVQFGRMTGSEVCTVSPLWVEPSPEEIAKKIVASFNAYDEMLAALQKFLAYYDDEEGHGDINEVYQAALAAVRSAVGDRAHVSKTAAVA